MLEAGDHNRLLAGYFYPVRERCFLRLRNRDEADEVAQKVFARLVAELKRGKSYSVPFRVVVWMVVDWTLRGHYPGAKVEAELPEQWGEPSPDEYAVWEASYDLGLLFETLPPRQRQVLELRYREGLERDEIGERLGMSSNAVDQALHNGHVKLAEMLHA